MTANETFADLLAKSGLRQADLARLTGRKPVTVWRWVHGRVEPPAYAWTLLRQHVELKRRHQ